MNSDENVPTVTLLLFPPSSATRAFSPAVSSFDFIPSAEHRRDESASASRRSPERAESDIACLPRRNPAIFTGGVENSRKCTVVPAVTRRMRMLFFYEANHLPS